MGYKSVLTRFAQHYCQVGWARGCDSRGGGELGFQLSAFTPSLKIAPITGLGGGAGPGWRDVITQINTSDTLTQRLPPSPHPPALSEVAGPR